MTSGGNLTTTIIVLIALIFVLMIVTNAWMERRISALEQRWDEFLERQQQAQASRQGADNIQRLS
jgi:F0F1-type ATP synthase membrane subunit b/b'